MNDEGSRGCEPVRERTTRAERTHEQQDSSENGSCTTRLQPAGPSALTHLPRCQVGLPADLGLKPLGTSYGPYRRRSEQAHEHGRRTRVEGSRCRMRTQSDRATYPVMLDEIVAMLAPALVGATPDPETRPTRSGRLHPRSRRPRARPCSRPVPQAHLIGLDRDPGGPGPGRGAARAVRRPDHPRRGGLRRAGRGAGRARHAPGPGGAARPRAVLAADRRHRAAASRTPSTPRWTCGWTASRS